ncbi:MAG: murein transglycosylase [Rhodospirillales bacterium]|nr:murein transglycosylase [Rhodospirillales bacterium]
MCFILLLAGEQARAAPQRLPFTAPMAWAGGCTQAIAVAERDFGIPHDLLAAIGMVETGRPDPRTGQMAPWPWSVDIGGQGAFYATREEAIAAVRAAQARGIRSIDVGCLQVNLLHHPAAFPNLQTAFDPMANAAYAARFLNRLFAATGAWPKAAGMYHSATPELGIPYQAKVMAVWHRTGGDPGAAGGALVDAWAATLAHPMVTTSQAMGFLPPRRAVGGVLLGRAPMIGVAARGTVPGGAAHGLAFYRAMPIAARRFVQAGN